MVLREPQGRGAQGEELGFFFFLQQKGGLVRLKLFQIRKPRDTNWEKSWSEKEKRGGPRPAGIRP